MNIMASIFSGGVTRFYCKYYIEGNTEQMENTLALSRRIFLILGFVAIVVGVVVSWAFGLVYENSLSAFQLRESSFMIAVLVLNLIVMMHNTIDVAVISTHERFGFLKVTQLASVVLQPLVIIILVSWFPYACMITCVQLAMNLVCAIVQRVFARKVLGAKVALHSFDRDLLKSLLVFSSGVFLVFVADQIFWKSNQLILGFYFGSASVAIYAVAAQIYMAYMPIGTAISSVFMPRISQLFHGDKDLNAISNLFAKVGRLSLYPLLAVLFGFAVFGKEFIELWVGLEYEAAYLIALVVMIPFTIDLMQNMGLTIMQVMDRYYFRGKMYLTIAVINIVLVVVVAPSHGALGAAVCSAFSMLVGNGIIMNVYYQKVIGLDMVSFWKSALRVMIPLGCFASAVFVAHALIPAMEVTWTTFGIHIMLYAVGFALFSYFFSMNSYEKGLVRSVVSVLKSKAFNR